MTEQSAPAFNILRVYLKDASLEQPNSPAILLEQQQPTVDIQLGVGAEQVSDGIVPAANSAMGRHGHNCGGSTLGATTRAACSTVAGPRHTTTAADDGSGSVVARTAGAAAHAAAAAHAHAYTRTQALTQNLNKQTHTRTSLPLVL